MSLPEISTETANGLAGLAALVTNIILVPTMLALRKIVSQHEKVTENHEERITVLETPKKKRPTRTRRPARR